MPRTLETKLEANTREVFDKIKADPILLDSFDYLYNLEISTFAWGRVLGKKSFSSTSYDEKALVTRVLMDDKLVTVDAKNTTYSDQLSERTAYEVISIMTRLCAIGLFLDSIKDKQYTTSNGKFSFSLGSAGPKYSVCYPGYDSLSFCLWSSAKKGQPTSYTWVKVEVKFQSLVDNAIVDEDFFNKNKVKYTITYSGTQHRMSFTESIEEFTHGGLDSAVTSLLDREL